MIKQKRYKDFSLKTHLANAHDNYPSLCQMELTFDCPFNCAYCYNRPLAKNPKPCLKTREIKDLIDDLKRNRVLWLCFTGGDPLARKDFGEIYRYAYNQGFLLTVFTSGFLLNKKFLNFCFLLIFIFGWQFLLKNYQKERIISFIAPQLTDSFKISWNQEQAEIAIGSGGFLGQGIGKGSQTQYGFLPEPQTDFIFAALAEEMGLIGVTFLFFLFWVLIWRIMRIAISSQTNFPRLFASGFSILLVSQIFINVGMNVGILPIIGIPLPLVSYGGGSLVSTFIVLGLLQSIKTH